MNIVFFAHPLFLNHQSMPRFTQFLADGMRARGHTVTIWMPQPKALKLKGPQRFKKWLGYIDQFFFFPRTVKARLKNLPSDTLFVFTDHALGPWVPLVSNRPHMIHCHDFLAQKSALNQIPQNPTGWTGKYYQKIIHSGYSKGLNFMSVSKKTQNDLHTFLPFLPSYSQVVYNGLNQSFAPQSKLAMRTSLTALTNINLNSGYILHVGGNQWYKNRIGVLAIYESWRNTYATGLPLMLVGQKPESTLLDAYHKSAFKSDIHFLSEVSDQHVKMAYAGASLFLFPSLAEGFGWPIAEAMASGCPVITTDAAPMNEVAADAAFYIPIKPRLPDQITLWALASAQVLENVLNLPLKEQTEIIQSGINNAQRFDSEKTLDAIEKGYLEVLEFVKND